VTTPYKNSDIPFMDMTSWIDHPVMGKILKRGPKIPVIRLSGVIADTVTRRGGLSYDRVKKVMEKAFAMRKAPAVAIVINSPGGAPAQSQLIGKLIRQLADEKEITVYAFVEDVAASGGYWLACAADHIYVQETSIVGSIGVISTGFGLEDFIDKHGIKRRLYTAGRDKSMLDPFLPEKPGDVARLKEAQSQLHKHFITWVKDRRGGKLEGSDDELFEGRFWTGTAALDMGLADDIGDVRSVMREKYGEDIRLMDLSPDKKRLPFIGSLIKSDLAEDILSVIEDRSAWARFGL
jgi:serine protease SohB